MGSIKGAERYQVPPIPFWWHDSNTYSNISILGPVYPTECPEKTSTKLVKTNNEDAIIFSGPRANLVFNALRETCAERGWILFSNAAPTLPSVKKVFSYSLKPRESEREPPKISNWSTGWRTSCLLCDKRRFTFCIHGGTVVLDSPLIEQHWKVPYSRRISVARSLKIALEFRPSIRQ